MLFSRINFCCWYIFQNLLSDSAGLPPALLQYGMFSSTGCSSDSGMSDDGDIFESRLGTLRRLAKQLGNSLTPGSHALKIITERICNAEAELRTLQETCRELILRTTASHNQFLENINLNSRSPINVQIPIIAFAKQKGKGKRKLKKRSPHSSLVSGATEAECLMEGSDESDTIVVVEQRPSRWWRYLRYIIPIQFILLAIFLATYGLGSHSCADMNSFQNSFNPQLKYIKGPPPI